MSNHPLSWKSKILHAAKSILSVILVFVVWTAVYVIVVIVGWSTAFAHSEVLCQGVGVVLFIFGAIAVFKGVCNALRTDGYKAAYPGFELLLVFLVLFGLYKLYNLAVQLLSKAYAWYEHLLPPGVGDKICLGLCLGPLIIVLVISVVSSIRDRNENWTDDDGYY